ncbi:DUF2752 domain-containing protein [Flavobacterium faecale]|uniref:DUF2752 domain-containing protein n=1 Tax=Flavobacterium faecale TaxID=1355330 RepID=UPI003AAFB31A
MMDIEKFLLPCFSKILFNFECLGCGFQRAFLLLLQGQFKAAFEMYPAIYTCCCYLFYLGIHYFYKKLSSEQTILQLSIINLFIMMTGYYIKH